MDVTGMNATLDTVVTMIPKPSKPKICAAHALEVRVDPATTQTMVQVMSQAICATGTTHIQTHAETMTLNSSLLKICAASVVVEATQETGPSPCLPNLSASAPQRQPTLPMPPLEAQSLLLFSALTMLSNRRARPTNSSLPENFTFMTL